MIMQILAWMWCIIFSFYVGSWLVFGISEVAHLILIAGICITVATFKTAKNVKDTLAVMVVLLVGSMSEE